MERDPRDADFVVLLYDRKRYTGEKRDPTWHPGMCQFLISAYARQPGRRFHDFIWGRGAATYEEARALVPSGGRYFDRSGNWPSPMVPIEGWYFDSEPAAPPEEAAS